MSQEEKRNSSFSLKDINLTIEKGELVMVIGDIGSGKSSLLYAIFGEMSVFRNAKDISSVNINGSVSYLG
jgi:ABC-type lipoprotein export system ATPase subunit